MNTPSWAFALFVSAAVANIIAVVRFWRKKSRWGVGATIVILLLIGAFAYWMEVHYEESILTGKTITLNAGTFEVDAFLRILSLGEVEVVMDPSVAEELRKKNVKIKTPAYKDVPFTFALDEILARQLPGPEQWGYEVTGKTVRIKRRVAR